MNDNKIIDLEQIKFHVNCSKKLLLELHLKPFNIDNEALNIIADSFDTLLLNLESEINSNLD